MIEGRARRAVVLMTSLLTLSAPTWAVWSSSVALVAVTSSTAHADDEDDEEEREAQAERFWSRAVRFAQRGKNKKALEEFIRAVPYMNDETDIFYNVVNFAYELREWKEVSLYGLGFLFLSEDEEEKKEVLRRVQTGQKFLRKYKGSVEAVSFKVKPKGVTITVNHVPVARSGDRSVLLPLGKYTARAKKDDYHPWSQTFEVKKGEPVKLSGKMKKIIYKGKLKIVTDPPEGVTIKIDGKRIGTSPMVEPREMDEGRYLVRFEKDGYHFWHRYVDIERDQTYLLEPVMELEGYEPEEDY